MNNSLSGCVILIVGGTGLTGSSVVRRLVAMSAEDTVIRVMSRSADPAAVRQRLGADVQVVTGDVGDGSAVAEAIVGVTHVFYLVGPVVSPAYVFSGETVEAAYVRGLTHVLRASETLRQVVLLSAENCDRPWDPMTIFANNVAGMSQLMHLRQERLLRQEAQRRPDFGYLIVRPPMLGSADAPPERVTLQSVDSSAVPGRRTRAVSRAAMAEVMVHALAVPTSSTPRRCTFTLSAVDTSPAPADFDWAGLTAALPDDLDDLAPASMDRSHARARLSMPLGVGAVMAGALGTSLWAVL